MKLLSWNVNGIRACLKKCFMDFFDEIQADIFCIQETKAQAEQVHVETPGYYQYWNSAVKKGYSGTAVFSKYEPSQVIFDMGIPEHDQEGRIITLQFDDFYLVNVYAPNSQNELKRLAYRMRWEDDFHSYLKNLQLNKPVILCGDLNVAHKEIDLKNPKTNHKSAGFTDAERQKMTRLLNTGFIDTFRYFNPELTGAYTWWSYIGGARNRNAGWRIDYFLVSKHILARVDEPMIYDQIPGSDHCPVGLTFR
ncbi:MAG: exodeoxyribonuclease III [Syntrophomonadaceae bacterium]|nr:exodeoxyribonuclease III [Syntrophomonadaceae bacterium]